MARAYYNEIDPFAAEWLRMLILNGEIAHGDVDTRSIEDVQPGDLIGYTQCHFFAGIGGWSRALRLAGWSDSWPIWTASCPCQPFSAAGKGNGLADERHLWPAQFWLLLNSRPVGIIGEQVASPAGLAWFDIVRNDLAAAGYSRGASDICAASIGAPHIRQRLYWGAYSVFNRREQWWTIDRRRPAGGLRSDSNGGNSGCTLGTRRLASNSGRSPSPSGEGEFGSVRESGLLSDGSSESAGEDSTIRRESISDIKQSSESGELRNSDEPRSQRQRSGPEQSLRQFTFGSPGPVNGFWRDAEWWYGKDGKFRPTQPGLFPLAHGVPGRVGKLRGYGNAIVPPLAAKFIEAFKKELVLYAR